jgi:arabinofuranan 3-O-arabinosyltransferase
VRHVDVLPYGDSRGRPVELSVEGRAYELKRGWNRLPVDLRGAERLRLRIERSITPSGREASAGGGLREVRVPGVSVREWLRTPRLVSAALSGLDLRRNELSILLERSTAPRPFQPRQAVGALQRGRVRDSRDAEDGLARIVRLPARRSFEAEARVSVAPSAPDDALDRLAGGPAGARLRSSSRFEGRPVWRASAAFDGDPRTGWVGEWVRGHSPWIEWGAVPARAPRRLRLRPAAGARVPTLVRLRAGGAASDPLRVGAGGKLRVPPGLPRARRLRLEVLGAAWPAGTPAWMRERRAVGIAELEGPGVPRVRPSREALPRRCGELAVRAAGRTLALRVEGTRADFEAGRPLPARSCGSLALPAGETRIEAPAAIFRVDHLRLRSPAPRPAARAAVAGRVVDPGTGTNGRIDGVDLRLAGPAWLVLGEGYNRGWRASCDGRDLGEPVPVDGFANGWPIERGCREASFVFAPGEPARWIGLGSGLACLAMLALLLVRRPRAPDPRPAPLPPDEPERLPAVRALAVGAVAAVVLGAVFALRSGAVLGPLVAFLLWRGVPARMLALSAGALLGVAVPLLYVLFPPEDRGGWNTDCSGPIGSRPRPSP